MEKIRVVYVEPGKEARAIETRDDLNEMQALVGGHIEEYMPFDDEVALICNEEGKITGLPLNRGIENENGQLIEIIAGPFFIAYAPLESEEFLSLPSDLEEKYKEKFRRPERFFKTPAGIKAVKYEPAEPNEKTQLSR